jgi:clostripain
MSIAIAAGLFFGSFIIASSASATMENQGKRPWTFMVYGAVDNSADGAIIEFLDQVRAAIDDDPGIELLLFIDRSKTHLKRKTYLGEDFTGTRLYRLCSNSVERLSGGDQFPEITPEKDGDVNSADATNLQRFIAWGKSHYPAQRFGLMIYSHADGKGMCPDARTGERMGIPEVTEKVGRKEKVDFLALELCQMGGIEIAYQWRPGNGSFEADVLVAIPNIGPPLNWERAFARIRSPGHKSDSGPTIDPTAMTAADFGRLVIEEGYRGRQISRATEKLPSKESAGCYNLSKVDAVKRTVDALSAELGRIDSKSIVLKLRGTASDDSAFHYSQDGSYVDLFDLCKRISRCQELSLGARLAAKDAMIAIERFIIASFGMDGYKGFQPGKHGVFIVLPSGEPGCWRSFRWYSPNRGNSKNEGGWSFLKDIEIPQSKDLTTWYKLLKSWFSDKP